MTESVTDFRIVIPARFGSTRLPGKPLREIAGKPMVIHVVECARRCMVEDVVVATDDQRIASTVELHGGDYCMTSDSHETGTDRLAEVVEQRGWSDEDIVVNLQGDEPLMPSALLLQVATNLKNHPEASIATLCTRITSADELFDPNAVKVVMDSNGIALYFSRAPIPWNRDSFAQSREYLPEGTEYYRHLGLYAYRVGFLRRFRNLAPAPIEQAESLEQLRALWHGEKIHVDIASELPPAGVDTEEDLQRIEAILKEMG